MYLWFGSFYHLVPVVSAIKHQSSINRLLIVYTYYSFRGAYQPTNIGWTPLAIPMAHRPETASTHRAASSSSHGDSGHRKRGLVAHSQKSYFHWIGFVGKIYNRGFYHQLEWFPFH